MAARNYLCINERIANRHHEFETHQTEAAVSSQLGIYTALPPFLTLLLLSHSPGNISSNMKPIQLAGLLTVVSSTMVSKISHNHHLMSLTLSPRLLLYLCLKSGPPVTMAMAKARTP